MIKALKASVNIYSRRLVVFILMFQTKDMNPTLALGETTINEQLSVLITNKNLCASPVNCESQECAS